MIHAFQGGSDGSSPYYGGLISDSAGNAYGTTAGGGGGCADGGCGTVFKLANDRRETVLYAFKGGSDGASPFGALLRDGSGNLYGTTASGGGCAVLQYGCGTVFRLAPDGTETVLYAFQGGSDGYQPVGNVVTDQSGNLYGTTGAGGNDRGTCGSEGCGTLFEVHPDGTKVTVYAFQGGEDGGVPSGALIANSSGNLYGTAVAGGKFGFGAVFEVTPTGNDLTLYAFQGGVDGGGPMGGVTMDTAGDLYGTTFAGGAAGCCGVVFEVPAGGGSESVLYSFHGRSDGANPVAGVVMDAAGNLYGTTFQGGGIRCRLRSGCGTVFKLTPGGQETVLARFRGGRGQFPEAPVLLGKNGALYGTASAGGRYKDGVVFKIKQ